MCAKPRKDRGSGAEPLSRYRAKRDPERTPEPFGGARPVPSGARRFVVQLHAARRLHHDLRLEHRGVLRSWAIPRGFSADPADKHLAVETEDHPLDYAGFEGVIPAGEYGGGSMIVWDRGVWVPLEDPDEGEEKGKLLFELRGHKLRGVWTLVRTKGQRGSRAPARGAGAEWLLIKERDGWVRTGEAARFPERSILSGLSVEELATAGKRATAVEALAVELGAARREVDPAAIEVMKAETAERAFSAPGWAFELKHDGYRVLAARDAGHVRLIYRSGRDATETFPDVARAVAALPYSRLVLDGEAVALDESGRPSFQRLQQRGQLRRTADVEAAAVELPVTYFVFDVLAIGEHDLRPLPLRQRQRLLREIVPEVGVLRRVDAVEERGEDLYAAVVAMGLEGIVAKLLDAPYRGGRRPEWLKIRADRTGDFAVVGWHGSSSVARAFGGLHLGARDPGASGAGAAQWVYVGSVGSGFSGAQQEAILRELATSRVPRPPFAGAGPTGRGHTWVEPRLVCEVRYKELTEDLRLRHPVFLRRRDDKGVDEAASMRELAGWEGDAAAAAGAAAPAAEELPAHEVAAPGDTGKRPPERAPALVSNAEKVFWPDDGYTKGDLVGYYRAMAPTLMPYLADRPLVVDRYPDGIGGKSFYQQHLPANAKRRVRTVKIWVEQGTREVEYFLVEDADDLLHLANLAAIPLHVWASRIGHLDRPDWCVLDLDPKGAPMPHTVRIANLLRELCDELGLASFAKTSGGTGIHVLIALGGTCRHEASRQLAELLARLVVAELPAIATLERQRDRRGGRVYVDFMQNGHAKLIAAPYSVRPFAGAPVSTPLRWSEVVSELDPRQFTLRTVPPRLKRLRQDPLRAVLDRECDLEGALARLATRL